MKFGLDKCFELGYSTSQNAKTGNQKYQIDTPEDL